MSFVLREFLPPIIRYSYGLIRAYFFYVIKFNLLQKNSSVKNSKENRAVYILGNGPSLNNFNIEKLDSCEVITMNYFYLHPKVRDLNVVAHCIGEPYGCTTWVDPKEMVNRVCAETYWFNITASDYCKNFLKEKDCYFYLPGLRSEFGIVAGIDLAFPALNYQSTAQMAIMIAMHMGYKKIYLLGFDHDWLVTRGCSPHFYEEDANPDVLKADFSGIPYLDMIKISEKLFKVYGAINSMSKRHEVKIVNLTRPTYLDVFPYED